MSMSDKEIALDLTKAFLEHLSARAQSDVKSESHATIEGVRITYKAFYETISSVDKDSKKG